MRQRHIAVWGAGSSRRASTGGTHSQGRRQSIESSNTRDTCRGLAASKCSGAAAEDQGERRGHAAAANASPHDLCTHPWLGHAAASHGDGDGLGRLPGRAPALAPRAPPPRRALALLAALRLAPARFLLLRVRDRAWED